MRIKNLVLLLLISFNFFSCKFGKKDLNKNKVMSIEKSINTDTLFNKISFEYPLNWDIDESLKSQGIYGYYKTTEKYNENFTENFMIQKFELKNYSFKIFVEKYLEEVKTVSESYYLHNFNKVIINNFNDVYKANFSYYLKNDRMGAVVTFFQFDEKTVFVFFAQGLNNEKKEILLYMKDYKKILHSIKKI